MSLVDEFADETTPVRKQKKNRRNLEENTAYNDNNIKLKIVFKKGTCIHSYQRWAILVRDTVYQLKVYQFISIQNQA